MRTEACQTLLASVLRVHPRQMAGVPSRGQCISAQLQVLETQKHASSIPGTQVWAGLLGGWCTCATHLTLRPGGRLALPRGSSLCPFCRGGTPPCPLLGHVILIVSDPALPQCGDSAVGNHVSSGQSLYNSAPQA